MFIIIDSMGYLQTVHDTIGEATEDVHNALKGSTIKWVQGPEQKDKYGRSYWPYIHEKFKDNPQGCEEVCRIYLFDPENPNKDL